MAGAASARTNKSKAATGNNAVVGARVPATTLPRATTTSSSWKFLLLRLVVTMSAVGVCYSPLGMYLGPGISCSSETAEEVLLDLSTTRTMSTTITQEGEEGSSTRTTIINEGLNHTVYACRVFSETYEEARTKFRHAAQLIPGSELYTLPVVEGDYSIDIAFIPGTVPGLTILSSGVHGIEGYAGSAIQIAAIQSLAETKSRAAKRDLLEHGEVKDSTDDDAHEEFQKSSSTQRQTIDTEYPSLVFIHAFNPYGMAKYRRFNENNVDLNRNGLRGGIEEWKSYTDNHFNKQSYDAFDPLFNPTKPPSLWESYIVFVGKIISAVLQHGIPKLKAAMVGGQYHKPTGIFYGGGGGNSVDNKKQYQPERSYQVLEDWFQYTLFKIWNWSGQAITWTDVHTGLGAFGKDVLLMGHPTATDVDQSWIGLELQTWFPDSPSEYQKESKVASDVNQGYENVRGLMESYFHPLLVEAIAAGKGKNKKQNDKESDKILLFEQEFGTIPVALVGHALMVENAAYQNLGPDDEETKLYWAKKALLPAFYPHHPHWRKEILQRGIRVLYQSMERSKTKSKPPATATTTTA